VNQNVHYRFANVDGHKIFYREAGSDSSPVLVLLHGFPTSSYMFRDLVPQLADRYHLIAPDHLGFGLSDAPSVDEFEYSFDALADITAALLKQLGISQYGLYVQDYGAPIGWRLALRCPEAITAIITQNGNAYEAGLIKEFWAPIMDYQGVQNAETEKGARWNLTLEATRWQYTF
jgi:pimeloyl-ACP methyl ester carboxylesterase